MDLEGLSVVCAGLGCASEDANGRRNGYVKSDNCIENLRDLQRFLRRDHPQTRDVFKQLGKWKTMSQDLIPIIEHYRDEPETITNAVKVIVFLTMPIDPSSDDISIQMEYLWSFKELFSRNDSIAVIVSLLEKPLEHLERGAFTEDDWKIIQLVFTLFRNLLAIQDPSPQQMMGRSASQFPFLRDAFLEHLFHENVMDLLLALTQHVSGMHGFLKQDNLLLLEIYHYMFWGQQPDLVASAQQMNSKKDNKILQSSGVLRSMMEEEQEQRRLSRLRDLPRHSLFCGTFVRLAPDGSKRIVKRNPFVTPAESILKTRQNKRGPVKRIACDTNIPLSSKESVLGLLQNFADEFLDVGYNVLMQSVREDIRREHPAIQNSDIVVFFEVACFFTAYQRCRVANRKGKSASAETKNYEEKGNNDTLFQGLICGPIASTMNEAMFQIVVSKWHSSFETLKETSDLKTLTSAGALVKEMIHMLDLVLKISRNNLKEAGQEDRTARVLLYKVFYDQTEQGITKFLLTLIKSFDIHKQPRSYLADLVEMTHIILRLMEALKEADGTLRVLKKSRRGRKKKRLADNQQEQVPVQSKDNGISSNTSEIESEKRFDCNEQETNKTAELLEEGLSTGLHTDDVEEHNRISKSDDKGRVQQKSSLENADECEEEVEFLEKNTQNGTTNSLNDEESNSEDDDQGNRIEADFDIQKFTFSFADNNVIQKYCWLLMFYKKNSAATNHYIIRMLQRICDDCMLAPMLYQLSVLSIFYEILSDQRTLQSEEYKNIVQFLTKILRDFFKKLKDQPFLFVEILFWKTRRDCNMISTDQLLSKMNKWKNKVNHSMKKNIADALGGDEADGINEWQSTEVPPKKNIADALGDDEADMPFGEPPNYGKETYTKEQKRESPKKRKSFVFSEEEEGQIKELFEQYKGNRRCSSMIAEALDQNGKFSTIQISRKLKQLGLKVASSKNKSGIDKMVSDENVESEEDIKDKPISAEAGKTNRRRLFLDSEDESEHEILHHDSLKASEKQSPPIKDKNMKSPKKRKNFVFSEEQEGLIKELFEQHKENRECSHLIAESLGLSVSQINLKLKLLGLKATSRKRKVRVESPNSKDDEAPLELRDEDNMNEEPLRTELLKTSDKLKSSTKDRNKNSPKKRKRYVFSEEQERLMKELFEQNKENKQCSHLIAKILGLPVIQVKRKLALLGLKVNSKKQKSCIGEQANVKHAENSAGMGYEDDSDHAPLMSILSKSSNIRHQKRKLTEALNEPVKKSGMVDEGNSDNEPLNSRIKRSHNTRLSKGKLIGSCKTSLKEPISDEDFLLQDDTENETLMTSLLKMQKIKLQSKKVTKVYNEPLRETGIAEHCQDKEDKIVCVPEGEDNSDAELLITKLRSPSLRPSKGKMADAYDKLVKDNEIRANKAVEDDTVQETPLTVAHLLKDRLKKRLSTEIGEADQSPVDLSDNSNENISNGKNTGSLAYEGAGREMLEDSNSFEDDIVKNIFEENLLALVNKEAGMEILQDTILLRDDLQEDNLKEKLLKGNDDDLFLNEEAATMKTLKDTKLLNDMEEESLEEKVTLHKDNAFLVDEEAHMEMLEDTILLEDDLEEDNLKENLFKGKEEDSLEEKLSLHKDDGFLVDEEADLEMLKDVDLSRRGRRRLNMVIEDDD